MDSVGMRFKRFWSQWSGSDNVSGGQILIFIRILHPFSVIDEASDVLDRNTAH